MNEPLYRFDKAAVKREGFNPDSELFELIRVGVLVPVEPAYYQNSDGVDPEDVLIQYLVERGVDKDNAYGIAHHLVHSVLYSVTKAVMGAGIGDTDGV